jgi:iron(III) transport system ATP-binding protein
MTSTVALAMEAVSLQRAGRLVLDAVSFELQAGEILALVGPSASGKTSVVRVLLGLERPQAGRVVVDGRCATNGRALLTPPEARGLAVVFQDLALWPHLSVRGNLAFALDTRRVPRPERDERITRMLERVGLRGFERRRTGELSGGERQRVAIARALVLEPTALLLDEPFANLDVVLKRDLLAFLREVLAERQVPALFVTHDPREAAALASRMVVIECGRVVQSGTLDDIRAKPATAFVASFVAAAGSVPGA